jgi:sodium transport system ATP-binding protein
MIQAISLSKVFQSSRAMLIHAVREAGFEVPEGEVFGLIGPNGAGKTTLLRMLAGIVEPTAGHCTICGHDVTREPQAARRCVGFLSGNTKLYGRLTPAETLQYFGRLYGMRSQAIKSRTDALRDMLDMGEFMGRRCDSLSTGQLQRVSIARCIVHDPRVLILDEPTLGLDIMTSRTIFTFIRDARERGRAIIFSTHYMTEAELLCDRIALMHRGRILATDTLEALREAAGATNLQDIFLNLVGREDAPA